MQSLHPVNVGAGEKGEVVCEIGEQDRTEEHARAKGEEFEAHHQKK